MACGSRNSDRDDDMDGSSCTGCADGEGDMFITTSDEEDLLALFRELTPESQEYLMKQLRILQYMEQHKDK